mgnify:CR=1 FL=1
MLRTLTPNTDERLIVDASTGDDAAVWRLDPDRALVVTADFITPLVDDARTWGRIAAANSVSDVYAMGGRPILALNLVGWNADELPADLLGEVLLGAQDIARDGGFVVAGGHTIDDPEPKFGMAVVGEVHPDRVITNAGLLPGQSLVLTKALGIGILATASKASIAEPAAVDAAVASMTRLNDVAARLAVEAGVTGGTDVTGFGLLGHLGRAAVESAVDVELDVAAIPVLPSVRELLADGVVPGGTRRNLQHVEPQLDRGSHDDQTALLLADAQTSGGLVVGVDDDAAAGMVDALVTSGHAAAIVGRVTGGTGRISLR